MSKYDFVCLLIDGKYLAKEQMIIAMGITIKGEKIPLDFIQSTTENSLAVKGLLQRLIERNFGFQEGLLVVCDGSKGIIKAVIVRLGSLFCIWGICINPEVSMA